MRYPKFLSTIQDKSVAITGRCWIRRSEIKRLIYKNGGTIGYRAKVNSDTNVLIKGTSSHWSHKSFGDKELVAANLIKKGKIILVVNDYDFRRLIEKKKRIKILDTIAGQPLEWLLPPPPFKEYLKIAVIKGSLDRDQTIKGRIEQSYLREILFKESQIASCGLCNKKYPIGVMVAAHIKPRSQCSIKEKKDFNNIVFPLCQFGCDILYERGYISIDQKGKIKITHSLPFTNDLRIYLNKIKLNKCAYWREKTIPYFNWHFERRFQQ